jgi:hypothetical protein
MIGFTCIHGPSSSFTTFSKKTVMMIKEVKDLLSLRFQKETDIMHPERHRERERERESIQEKKSFTRPNWTPAPKIQKKEMCCKKQNHAPD